MVYHAQSEQGSQRRQDRLSQQQISQGLSTGRPLGLQTAIASAVAVFFCPAVHVMILLHLMGRLATARTYIRETHEKAGYPFPGSVCRCRRGKKPVTGGAARESGDISDKQADYRSGAASGQSPAL